MMPFWCACCTAWQTVTKQFEPLASGEIALVAVFGDRDALHQFHDEVWSAGVRRPGVEDLGDVRVVHHGQGLPFGLEAGDHLARVHPGLDDLQRHATADGPLLLGHEHHAKAALADLLQQLVRPDDGPWQLRDVRHFGRCTKLEWQLQESLARGCASIGFWIIWRRCSSPSQARARNASLSAAPSI